MVKGINAKESRGEINLGINLSQFISQLGELQADEKGWVNLILKPRRDPCKGGYTHIIVPQKKRKSDGGTEG